MKRRVRNLDRAMLVAVGLLLAGGIAISYSTTVDTPREPLFFRHLIAVVCGIAAYVAFAAVPYRYFDSRATIAAYAAGLLLLALVPVIGFEGLGAKRWMSLGPIAFQPSEFAKLTTLFAIARFYARRSIDPRRPETIAKAVALVAAPMVLILGQPDLGTALAFLGILLAALFWAGTPLSWLLYVGALGVTGLLTFRLPPIGPRGMEATVPESLPPASAPTVAIVWVVYLAVVTAILRWRRARRRLLVTTLVAHLAVGIAAPHVFCALHDYQRGRIVTFVDPGREPTGAGYQVIQSQIAIGSGQVAGKGYLRGTQKALAYLPQQHTDFAFSVVGEEFGFLGGVVALGLFLLLLTRGVRTAHLARDRFGSMLGAGAVGILTYHVFVNLFMTMGLAPVTGLPLPFISYGGSFMFVAMALCGILQNIAMRRRTF